MNKTQKPSLNALQYGIHSTEIVLPWESAEEFLSFQEQVLRELGPQGVLELEIATDVVRLMWLKRRLRSAYQLPFWIDATARDLAEVKDGGLPAFAAKLQDKAKTEGTLYLTGPQMLDRVKAKLGLGEAHHGGPPVRADADFGQASSVVDRVFRTADLDRMLKTEASLDARIEKAIARLAGAKEFKRLYAGQPLQIEESKESS